MDIGKKLKSLREQAGYNQIEIAKILGTSQRKISYYETAKEVAGLLDYICKLCSLLKITVSEFFIKDINELNKQLPSFIKPDDIALLKIINTSLDIETQIEVKKVFIQIVKTILINKTGKVNHLPEYKILFKE